MKFESTSARWLGRLGSTKLVELPTRKPRHLSKQLRPSARLTILRAALGPFEGQDTRTTKDTNHTKDERDIRRLTHDLYRA